MAIPIVPTVAAFLLLSLALYRFIIFPASISPLAKIPPAHWSAPFSRLWILYYRSREEETPTIHAAHQRLGPIVRVAPNDISVNSVEGGIRNVYAGGYEKGDWYQNIFNNYGVMPMFAMPDHGPHSKRKRMLSNIYAKTTLQTSAALSTITKVLMEERLMPRLRQVAQSGKPSEFYWLFASLTSDIVSAYMFGLAQGTDYTQQPDVSARFFAHYKARQRYQFWPQDLPSLTRWLGMAGVKWLVVPKWVDEANASMQENVLTMCDAAERVVSEAGGEKGAGNPEDWPNVYAQLRNALLKEQATKTDLTGSVDELVQEQRLAVASEMLDHLFAGFDTSSISLVFLAWELSKPENTVWQEALRNEISTLQDKYDAKAVDNLPILQAIVQETLRLHAAIPGNQPRITPAAATLGARGHSISDLPPGVRVQAQAWSLHREPSVFPDPESWKPERWLSPSSPSPVPSPYASEATYELALKEMGRWFWAFGSGGRMCVGSNLAMYDMKAIVVAIWGSFRTSVASDGVRRGDEGMVHRGGYVAEPIGKDGRFLELRVEVLGDP
ncbi:hypothetical protein LTR35_009321 [Friedmanniomyces endolithicus]|uniref:Uncharacterized protein n=1 Tax=Friedmanniomyces endolithicus TaxID=329885 RepID=A0AAN6FCY8_9PEZI|nr:hypothetical protein LTS00_015441 [Friedmanniomyces endolithicus]KAK0278582.1 hypothetical protein LTR35_009321 [Friedmanniomyces endolithicus]KAK0310366.1 hypothetical protein LTR82_014752 [Friedmanniomyces endolithicus]KAK0993755.1 hypothetical protein LTR54_011047 [Friedmanniomyces endolithicus]